MNGATPSRERESAATAAFNEELAADAFLERLRDAATSDEVAFVVTRNFTELFRDFHDGRRTEQDTKQRVANLLIDEEPTMIDEFMQLFERCCQTAAWAGRSTPHPGTPPASGTAAAADAHMADMEGGLGRPPPLAQSASGIANISSAATQEVGTVAGTKPRSRSTRGVAGGGSGRRRKGPEGKLEWQAIAKRLVPEGRASYAIWFTVANIAVIVAIFAYMAGDYAMWVKENRQEFMDDSSIPARTDQDAEALLLDAGRVPNYLKSWLDWRATWQTFSFEFLQEWGGRWAPALDRGGNGGGAWWLWVTSIYVHQNLNHIISNLLLFIAMSVHLELNYGWWRLLLVWIISGVGANLVSAAFESACTLLVGASGAVFGFMGLFVADLVVNFESISWPFLRVLVIVLFMVFFIVNAVADSASPRVSHASHIGGVICGLFPSLLFLPNIRNKRIRALQRQLESGEGPGEGATQTTRNAMQQDLESSLRQSFWTRNFPINPLYLLGGLVVIAVYIVLPIYLYNDRLKDVCCNADQGTKLECVGTGQDGAISDARRRLLGPWLGGRGDTDARGGAPGSGLDPWAHLLARG